MDPVRSDTSAESERVLVSLYRKMSPADRLECVARLNRELELLAKSRIRAQYGDISDRELKLRLGALRIDRDLMIRACGWDPAVQGY